MKVIRIRQVEYLTAPEHVKEQLIQNQFMLRCPYNKETIYDWIYSTLNPWMDEYVQEGFYSLDMHLDTNAFSGTAGVSDYDLIARKFTPHDKDDVQYINYLLVRLTNPSEADMFIKQCLLWKLSISK
jgi:hypothetical protein